MIFFIFSFTKHNIYYFLSFYLFLLFFFFFFLFACYSNSSFFSYIDIEYILPKMISNWSNLENTYVIITMINVILFIFLTHYFFYKQKQFFYLTNILILSYITYINYYNQLYLNKFFFNSLLNHTMGSIHPPLMLLSIYLFRYYVKEDNVRKTNLLFVFLTLSLYTGAIWSSTLFGWNGLWMWDPIENISFFYWILTLFLIHNHNRKFFFLPIFFFLIDFYFFIVLKINLIESIHQFQFDFSTWKINTFPLIFFFFYFFIFILFLFFLSKKTKIEIKKNVPNKITYTLPLLIFFIFPTEINNILSIKNINTLLSFLYSLIYLYIIFIWINYANKKINIYTLLIMLILSILNFNLFFKLLISLLLFISLKRKSYFYLLHSFYIIGLFLFFFFLFNYTEKKNITHDSNILYLITENLTLIKYNDYFFKSIIENYQTSYHFLVEQKNNIQYPNTISYNLIFYKKLNNAIKDNTSLEFTFYLPYLISYNFYLKELTFNFSFFFTIMIYYFIIYFYRIISHKMRLLIIK